MFNDSDKEDSLQYKSWCTWVDDNGQVHVHSILYSFVYPVIVLCTLVMVPPFFESYVTTPLAIVSLLIAPYFVEKQYRWKSPLDVWPDFFSQFRSALEIFFIEKGKSASAILAIPVLWVLSPFYKNKYLPLGIVYPLFAVVFIVFFVVSVVSGSPLINYLHGIYPESSFFKAFEFGCYLNYWCGDKIMCRVGNLPLFMLVHFMLVYFQAFVVVLVISFVCKIFSIEILSDTFVISGLAHFSDLHMCGTNGETIESGFRRDSEVYGKFEHKSKNYKAVALTGDVTDGGDREQWKEFVSKVLSINNGKKFLMVMCPGNHDVYPYSKKYKPKISSLDMNSCLPRIRKIRYLRAVGVLCPNAIVVQNGVSINLDAFLDGCSGFFDNYLNSFDGVLNDEIDRLWDDAFPMYWRDEQRVYIALDTNRPPSNITTSAFGEIGLHQLEKLRQLIKNYAGVEFVVLGHHHIYTPPDGYFFKECHMKFLELLDSRGLVNVLKNVEAPCYYIHGHRHYDFQFKIGSVCIQSVSSLRFN